MRTIKIIGAGIFALFMFGNAANIVALFIASSQGIVQRGPSPSFILGNVAGVILWGLLAFWCWKSATAPKLRDETVVSPLPDVPQNKR